jgi:hypothetical protein
MIPEFCPCAHLGACTGGAGSVGYSLYDARDCRGGVGVMPSWRRMDAGACWGGRRDAPTAEPLFFICTRLQCPRRERLTGAQVGSVTLPLLTEPRRHIFPRKDRGGVFSSRLFFLVSRSRRSNGPRWDAPSRCHQPSTRCRVCARTFLERLALMIPDDPTPPQDKPAGAPLPEYPCPPRPCICPHCGHSHGGYDPQASTLLDCLIIATNPLSEAKRLIETEVLP